MTISEIEMNELLVSVSSKCERSIASAIFNLENVLREIIALIAANPQKLQVSLCSICHVFLNSKATRECYKLLLIRRLIKFLCCFRI